uniref:Immunoglobulin V-set domain-containing protein n=1 Tax=Amphilophus citrinellus TaxID=61819 RepID=A0A3Q0SQL4_AMPCI
MAAEYKMSYLCSVAVTSSVCLFLTDSCCNSARKIKSHEGYSESISCPYESQYQNNLKYICRGNRPSTCLQQALITSENKQNGRFRLDDEKESRKFTVTISSLSQNDSGSYLCGVQRNSDLDDFSAVELEVEGLIFIYAHIMFTLHHITSSYVLSHSTPVYLLKHY